MKVIFLLVCLHISHLTFSIFKDDEIKKTNAHFGSMFSRFLKYIYSHKKCLHFIQGHMVV
jgi:hypothetical protein